MRHMIVGTAGHIDHGKSALVKALTGVDPDRLKEERTRGITIDLGFAHLQIDDVHIGFVDVPGHERFVKNMLAGVGGIDCVLLVVAADESIMPQTREHYDICRLLGIQSGLIVLTKIDLAERELVELVRDEIRETVQGSFLEDAEIVPVSARTGEGLERLRNALYGLALAGPERRPDQLLRLPIDRAFSMRGFGTVVTGTLVSGTLEREAEVELLPGGLVARVRGLQVHGASQDRAVAGQRTAVNLQGVDLSQVKRGMSLTAPRRFQSTQLLDVRLDLLPASRPLKNLVKVRFHQGTSEVLARVALLGRTSLEPGNAGFAQLRLDAPVFCLQQDRFIIRQFSPVTTIGGGTVLNPHSVKHRSTDARVLELLRILDQGDRARGVAALIAMHPLQMMGLRELNSSLGLSETSLAKLVSESESAGAIVRVPGPLPILVLPEIVAALKTKTLALIERFHAENPLQRGMSREELRNRVYDGVPPEVYRFCMETLAEKRRISLHEDMAALYGREVQLSAGGMHIKQAIEELLRAAAWQPPSFPDIPGLIRSDPDEVRNICTWMLKEKILIRVSEDIVYLHTSIESMKQKILDRYPVGSKFGVAEFKELFGITRKHAIPLLEHLDRERFTRRTGNERILL
jgi:selenocysteine-specific elongation factor